METLEKLGKGFMIHLIDGLRKGRPIEILLELLPQINQTNSGDLDLSALDYLF